MPALAPGVVHHARIADLPPDRSRRHPALIWVSLFVEERLVTVLADPASVDGLQPGALVAFTVAEGGRLASLRQLGGPHPHNPWQQGDALRWRHPGPGGPPRMTFLRWRHRIVAALRAWFDRQDFLEAETPTLVPAPSPEPVFAPIPAGDAGRPDYLITSPEFQLKRMLVGGFERIYRLGPVFRGGERGAHHNPEFTLLEWYRAYADANALADDLARLLLRLAPMAEVAAYTWEQMGEAGVAQRLWRLGEVAARPALPQCTVRALLREHLGMELAGVTTSEALREAALAAGVPGAAALPLDFTAAFSELWVQVEAALPPEPLLVTEWPAPLASLARLKPGDPTVAERVELYAGGLELANGFAELTDPAEQRRRFEADLAARAAQGLPPVPLDEAFLGALAEGMPPAAGIALGVDRLAMLLTGAPTIAHVLPFAWDER